MNYKIQDTTKSFVAQMADNLGDGRYVISIDEHRHELEIIAMDSRGIEFVMDKKYHKVRYIGQSTNEMSMIVDNTSITLCLNSHLDDIVYKNSGGGSTGDAQLALKSQIPGKVVSVSAVPGDTVKKGDVICTLESMKMQVSVKSHKDGTIKTIKITESGTVAKGDVIAEIE